MEQYARALADFLDGSPSPYHAVDNLRKMLEQEDYLPLDPAETWNLVPGGKYYLLRNDSAVIAMQIPEGKPKGFHMAAAHSDRPSFQVKENPEQEAAGAYLRLCVEKYGGMLMAPWLDRPLSVAGRVLVQGDQGLQSRLVNIDRDLLLIPNVAIHMNRKANEGYSYNPAQDLLPLFGPISQKGAFPKQLAEAAGVEPEEILGTDLYLYVRQRASIWGPEEDYISAQGLDDLMCAYGIMEGFLQAKPCQAVSLCCGFDNEEVGSNTYQGADSDFLRTTLQRICESLGVSYPQMLAGSFLCSADNAHAKHPNHPEYADPANAPVLNGGIVLKFNANRRYTTDGYSAAYFRAICQKAGVPVQTYCNRADLPGGSTLGNISGSQVSVPTVDIGLAQLAMHSAYETAGAKDVGSLISAMKTFFEA